MIAIQGYQPIEYKKFMANLRAAKKEKRKTHTQVSSELCIGRSTASNAFISGSQVASDKVLTEIISAVGLDGFVVWVMGERYYYLKSNF